MSIRSPLTPGAALAVTAMLFAIAWIESAHVPWAPFYVVYVALTVGLPLWWKAGRPGSLRAVRGRHWLLAVACGVGAQVVLAALVLGLVPRLLAAAGLDPASIAGPAWNLPAAQAALFERLALRSSTDAAQLHAAYLVFLVVWAGFGEEVYFRGYLHAALGSRWRLPRVIAVASMLFGARHAMQLAALGSDYPWGAAVQWSLLGALFGVVLSWLYVRTGSLWPPILAHYMFNALPLALGALGGE